MVSGSVMDSFTGRAHHSVSTKTVADNTERTVVKPVKIVFKTHM